MHQRHGFTLIELLVSISIITILGLMAVPGTARAIARGAANKAADDIFRVAHQAQQFAKRSAAPGPVATSPHWGVAVSVDANNAISATVLYGTSATDEWTIAGAPGYRLGLPTNLRFLVDQGSGLNPLSGSVAWFYQYGTGWPIESPSVQTPISVGTPQQDPIYQESLGSVGANVSVWQTFAQYIELIPASPVCQGMVLATSNNRYQLALALYDTGMTSIQERGQ